MNKEEIIKLIYLKNNPISSCKELSKHFIGNHTNTIIPIYLTPKFEIEFNSKMYKLDKYQEVIDKVIELLGNYKHYSTPDEKQNSENEDLVNNVYDILKEVK